MRSHIALLKKITFSSCRRSTHWASSSSSKVEPSDKSSHASIKGAASDPEFQAQFTQLLPSSKFRHSLSAFDKSRYDLLLKQVELYCFMSLKVPKTLSDDQWRYLMSLKTVHARVLELEFIAVKARRQERDQERNSDSSEKQWEKELREQRELFAAGGMGYGPRMNELVLNPFRNQKKMHVVEGSKMWATLRVAESPTIVFDMQYVFHKDIKQQQSIIAKQMQIVITENRIARRPLPIVFAGVPDNKNGQYYMEKKLGQFGNQYQHQTLLPDYTSRSPRDAVAQQAHVEKLKQRAKIVYISKHAKQFIDGPLDADAYVLCASLDNGRESIAAAHREGIPAYRLPISKYVRWTVGPQNLPFPNIMRIFREVLLNGGDWASALTANISKRHLGLIPEELSEIRSSMRQEKKNEREEVANAITDAFGEMR